MRWIVFLLIVIGTVLLSIDLQEISQKAQVHVEADLAAIAAAEQSVQNADAPPPSSRGSVEAEVPQKSAEQLERNAVRLLESGALDSALVQINKSIMKDDQRGSALFLRGIIRVMKSQEIVAISDFDRAIELQYEVNQVRYHRALALAKVDVNRGEDALSWLVQNVEDAELRQSAVLALKELKAQQANDVQSESQLESIVTVEKKEK